MKKLIAAVMALCLMCALLPAFAQTADVEIVKMGEVSFTIPAGMELTRLVDNNREYQTDTYAIRLTVWTIDTNTVQRFLADLAKQNVRISFQQAAIMFGEVASGLDADTAVTFGDAAVEEDIGMLNGDAVMTVEELTQEGLLFYAQAYRGKYFSVIVLGETLSEEELKSIGRDIMLSVRLDGVTEEDMIADAQADYVVITAESGKIRGEASISGSLIKTAYKGETYELIREEGDWYVVDVNGRTGYIHKGVAAIQ